MHEENIATGKAAVSLPDVLELIPIAHNSSAYTAAVALRHAILRAPLGLAFTAEQLAAEADAWHLGAFLDGRLVGCLLLKPLASGELQMRQVAVEQALQGQGIGRQLVSHAEAYARQHGYTTMRLHARENAVPFYQRLDYRLQGEPFMEIGISHWLMLKQL
ncbi:acetyltransferase (GNAT) family protein [Methylovorus glucosotrophus]|uniref:GNAT family N-acetyltransferase n=1 Tax=Methylovorus glucosotrophus TaxID=266009 RepID=UPI001331B2AC|nr:GNAT family N-acetyltransferase [Methylovorus glucosotrophus]KAF0843486.1 acetyltransferase (GNAT) family protein [Methylovorus glucosotrophus]